MQDLTWEPKSKRKEGSTLTFSISISGAGSWGCSGSAYHDGKTGSFSGTLDEVAAKAVAFVKDSELAVVPEALPAEAEPVAAESSEEVAAESAE